MKKLLLSASALCLATSLFAQVPPGSALAGNGAMDDFSSATEVASASGDFGVYWFVNSANTDVTLVRNGDGTGTITCVNCGGTGDGFQSLFGVGFGDSNGPAVGGDAHYLDCSSDVDISISLTNTSSTDTVVISLKLEDVTGGESEIEPTITDVTTNWAGPRKGKIGLILAPLESGTFNIPLTNGGVNSGGLKADAWTCSDPTSCPTTSHDINTSYISKILFFVEPGAASASPASTIADYTNAGTDAVDFLSTAFSGDITISNFEIGTGQITLGLDAENIISGIAPNPTSGATVVSYNAPAGSDVVVSVSDLLGNEVASAAGSSSSAEVDASGLASGLYIVTVSVDGEAVSAAKLTVE